MTKTKKQPPAPSPPKPSRPHPSPLSPKQTKILQLYAQDIPTKQIITRLHTTRTALKRHKQKAFRRLNVHTTAAAVAKLLQHQNQNPAP